MKTWIKRTLIGLFGASALFGGLAVWTHKNHHHHGWQQMSQADAAQMKARVVQKIGDKLSLDDNQKAKLGLLAEQLRLQRNALVGSTIDPRAELQSMLAGSSFDRSKANALIQSKVSAVNEQSPALVAALADFFDSLKPEQQARVRELMARGGRWGHRG